MSRKQNGQQTIIVKQEGTSGIAIAGLAMSFLGWFTCGLLCIPGAFLSGLGLFSRGPKGIAIAGLIVGFPGVLFFVLVGASMMLAFLGLGAAATSSNGPDIASEVRVPLDSEGQEVVAENETDRLFESRMADYEAALAEWEKATEERSQIQKDLSEVEAMLAAKVEEKPKPPKYGQRTFTTVDGKFSVDAILVTANETTATIERVDDGRILDVPIEKLVASDRIFLKEAAEDFAKHSEANAAWEEAVAKLQTESQTLQAKLAKANRPKPEKPTRDTTPMESEAGEVVIDDETKNRIWWDVERSSDEVTKVYDRLAADAQGTQELIAAMEEAEQEVRGAIAKKYGITYAEAKTIHDEGETASWRTVVPPE